MTPRGRPPLPLLVAVLGALTGCDPIEPRIEEGVVTDLAAVAHGTTGFVAVGGTFHVRDDILLPHSDSAVIRYSADGETWSAADPSRAGTLVGVARGDATWIAVGRPVYGEGGGLMLRSTDGVEWADVAAPPLLWSSVAHQNDRFLALGLDQANARTVLMSSADGLSWETAAITSTLGLRLSAGDGLFLLWGDAGWIGVSADGETWDTTELDDVMTVTALAYGDGGWTGFGISDCCFGEVPGATEFYRLRSEDGRAWTVERITDRSLIMDLARHGETWLAIREDGIVRSAAAGPWTTAVALERTQPALDIAVGEGRIIVVGRETIWRSDDAVSWIEVPLD